MQKDPAVVPLTDLCAICHLNPIKYTCPRDGVHTCSLPCVKRHKQWAQCSGVRDPAEYRKRSELATEASIDKDFNFITKVERSLTRADDVVADKGIDLVPARLRPNDTRPKFELEAKARNIRIIKAPKGLSRSKQNKTYWNGDSKSIVWTLEWLCQDGRKFMSHVSEDKSLKAMFESAIGPRRHGRKRKRPSDAEEQRTVAISKATAANVQTQSCKEDLSSMTMSNSSKVQHTISSLPSSQPADARHLKPTIESNAEQEPEPVSNTTNQYFYLHRPNTESRFKCLIPIQPDQTLRETLNNKTIIEFPTIYIRDEPPDQLKSPFISEEEYLGRYGDDIPINITIPASKAIDEEELEDGEILPAGIADVPLNINEANVLEVLAKDLDAS